MPVKILLTAFNPFGGASVNPSWEAVSRVSEEMDGIVLKKLLVPTIFGESGDIVNATANEWDANAIICVGQAGGRYDISLERVAINLDDASIPDNAGNQPIDRPISENGSAAYFSSIPNKAIIAALHQAGIPASLSNTAGTYVCNHLLYRVMEEIALHASSRLGGFIHVPYLPQQVLHHSHTPSMSLECIVRALEIAVQTTARSLI
ncbi:MAG: pyroglutamyl-peptidase I [Candidatus Merdivicinus sp.]|jgi:pyroglutamyl-peptidase